MARPPIDAEWLRRRHDARPGCTSRSFADPTDPQGRSSYRRLAERVRPGERVLDLACGDGALMSEVLRLGRAAELVGIDFSEGELASARARLPPSVHLRLGPVQALPFADASFDRVLCHQALMLFDDLEGVLAEVARVLRPGGALHAVVGDGRPRPPREEVEPVEGPEAGDAWELLLRGLRAARFIDHPRLIDSRALRPADLAPLVIAAGLSPLRTEPFTLRLVAPPARIWAFFGESYDPVRMDPSSLAELRARFFAEVEARCDADGNAVASLRKLELEARR